MISSPFSSPNKITTSIGRRLTLTPAGMAGVLNASPQEVRDFVESEERKQEWNNIKEYAEGVAWELVIGNYEVPITSLYMIERINEIETPEHVWMRKLVFTST